MKKSFVLVVALSLALGCLGGCKEKEKIEIVDGHETIDGEVLINEANFPDDVFRNLVKRFDDDGNGRLSIEEIELRREFWISNQGIRDLKGIECFVDLVRLDCRGNELTELDLSKNEGLNLMFCSSNRLEKLTLPERCSVENFNCENNQLKELDLSGCYRLQILHCSNNLLTKLELQDHRFLSEVHCKGNPLTSLDLRDCPNLTGLEVDEGVKAIGAESLTQAATDAE